LRKGESWRKEWIGKEKVMLKGRKMYNDLGVTFADIVFIKDSSTKRKRERERKWEREKERAKERQKQNGLRKSLRGDIDIKSETEEEKNKIILSIGCGWLFGRGERQRGRERKGT